MKGKFIKRRVHRAMECCGKWWSLRKIEEEWIPEDVPKGHFVVYVGSEEEYYKRYVVEIRLLKDPLFKKLLDSAEEMFGFQMGPKLCLPCNQNVFLTILECIDSYSCTKAASET